MSARDHDDHKDDTAAYLLGALSDLERQAFESHLEGCMDCREQVEHLRPAADALPRSVEPLSPPPSLKAALMDVVEEESRERKPAPRRTPARSRLAAWAAGLGTMRLGVAGASAAFLLFVGLAGGYGVASLLSEDARRVSASVNKDQLPLASATLVIPGDEGEGAILRVHGLPSLRSNRVYQAWVERDGEVVPQPTFEVRGDGGGAVAVPDDLSDADSVLVTREPRGGARAPSEDAVLRVRL